MGHRSDTDRTTVVLDEAVRDEAKDLGINISEVCRKALRRAVDAVREARRLGDDVVLVTATQYDRGDEEQVEFLGTLVYRGDLHDEADYYVTPAGRVAVVDREEGRLWVVDDIDEMEDGPASRAAAAALGLAPRPTRIDI